MQAGNKKILVIVGPTATGKTKLSVEMAKRIGGEIISADSMQIYRDVWVGTASPTEAEQDGIPHHLQNFLPLTQKYSVADYVCDAKAAIEAIFARGNIPIVVGGTGLYVDSLLYNTNFSEVVADPALREELRTLVAEHGNEHLHGLLAESDPETAEELHPNNVGRVIRAIEVFRLTGQKMSVHKQQSRLVTPNFQATVIGLTYSDRQKLYNRINARVDAMVGEGILEEAKRVITLPPDSTALQAIGYKEFIPYLNGEATLEHCVEELKKHSRNYAKRQLTWFNKNTDISWIELDNFENFHKLLDCSLRMWERDLEK